MSFYVRQLDEDDKGGRIHFQQDEEPIITRLVEKPTA